MADGSVKIDVGMSTSKAEKELEKLKEKISKLEGDLNEKSERKSAIEKEMEASEKSIEATRQKIKKLKEEIASTGSRSEKAALKEQLAETTENYRNSVKDQDARAREYQKLSDDIDKGRESLIGMQEEAGNMEKVLAETSEKVDLSGKFDAAKKKLKSFIGVAFGITTAVKLFQVLKKSITESVKEFAQYDEETAQNIQGLKNSLAVLKVSWGAAFAPIFNAVVPLLQKLIGWLTSAANAIAQFMAVLSGKTTYKKAIQNNDALADSVGGVGAAAAEARKQLMAFDELNVLPSEGGGGGGGGGGSSITTEETGIDTESLPARLAFTLKEVLFNWDDLTAEDILAKALVGMTALGGAIVGGMVGGVPGVIIGLTAGLILGIMLDSTIFDFDGNLTRGEIINAAIAAGLGFAGAAIGFVLLGGPIGAALGLTLGLLLAFTGIKYDWSGVKESLDNFWQTSFGQYIDKWSVILSDRGKEIGQHIVFGIIEGLFSTPLFRYLTLGLISPLIQAVDWIKTVFGIHSPSTVMAEIGQNLVLGLFGGLQSSWSEMITWFETQWNSLKSWWEGLRLNSFKIMLPHLSWTWQEADGVVGRILSTLGLPSQIPSLNVSWYARGGIVDAPTLLGAGEDGKEAIVPLERHTEWISMVANGIIDRMLQSDFANRLADAFMSVPMPAMAGGSVVPRNAAFSGYGEDWGRDVLSELAALRSEISALYRQPVEVSTQMVLDKREIGKAVTRYQRQEERTAG